MSNSGSAVEAERHGPHGTAPGAHEECTRRHERAIIARDIVKEFHTEVGVRRVLDGISFRVGMGERMAVLGRNGAGKSTLVQFSLVFSARLADPSSVA